MVPDDAPDQRDSQSPQARVFHADDRSVCKGDVPSPLGAQGNLDDGSDERSCDPPNCHNQKDVCNPANNPSQAHH